MSRLDSGVSKRYLSGTHRLLDPEQTVARVRELFGPIGITRIANVTGLDCIGIPVVTVCRPNARSLAVSQGKGLTLAAARASGVMEAVELYHAERIQHPLKLASWNEIRFSHSIIAVDQLPSLSQSSFRPDRALLWIEGQDLFTGKSFWLPYELVHTNFTLPFPTGTGSFVMSSNGLASGNHLLEAINHGLCEVIERDAVTLWQLSDEQAQELRRLELRSVDDPECRGLISCFERAGVSLAVWDVTSDIGIACFLCVIVDEAANWARPLPPVEGMGCHPVREIALSRALTEVAQARLTLITGSRDDNGRAVYERSREQSLMLSARARLALKGRRQFDQVPTFVRETLEEDLGWILTRLKGAGLEQALAIDISKPEFGIPVVRVVVPGLETYHHVQGYVPGVRGRRVLECRQQQTCKEASLSS